MSQSEKRLRSLDPQSQRRAVNSILRDKLSGDILSIRESVQDLINKRGETVLQPPPRKQILRKKQVFLSSKDLDRITKNHSFNPLDRQAGNQTSFRVNVRKQMTESPLIDPADAQEINRARINGASLQIKMGSLDTIHYPTDLQEIQNKVKSTLQPKLMLPDKHYTISVLDNLRPQEQQQQFSLLTQPNFDHVYVTESAKKDGQPEGQQIVEVIEVYDSKKYSKADFRRLDTWFDDIYSKLDPSQPNYFRKGITFTV